MANILQIARKPILLGTSGIAPTMAKSAALEHQLAETARLVGTHIDAAYPGYPFYVTADGHIEGGCVLISIPRLTGQFRHIVPFSRLYTGDGMAYAVHKAGEILERFGLRRGQRNMAEWRECLRKNPVPAKPMKVRLLSGGTKEIMPDAVR